MNPDNVVSGGVAVGVRIDLFDQGEQYLGSILREDLRAAGVPRVGDNLGRGTLGVEVHQLAGIALEVDHVDHYLAIPGVRDREPLSVAVVVANGVDTEAFTRLAPTLKEQGWSVMSDSYPDS
ncbi:hypothetical protein [Gulosibacter massiliensis]|uniref:hypothetical protein n=1 Tax=Gulosibacter massiliensis TaxID=2479839 RepID=UPI000F62EB33|nr:hypothetical protein [Gulosibacter massiliensis]